MFSAQLKNFIIGTKFAFSSASNRNDSRTWVTYFCDEDGMVHSDQQNYSLVGRTPCTLNQFIARLGMSHYSEGLDINFSN